MAADGLMTQAGVIVHQANSKIERLPDGRIFGSGGDAAGGQMIRDWLADYKREGGKRRPFPSIEEETAALVLNLDGTVDLYEHSGQGQPIRVQVPMAIGSGMSIAIGAMDAGASPQRAVEIAALRIATVGGKIDILELSRP